VAGVVIVKNSSVNKCGGVCSSYEIIASMLQDTPEIMDVKQELVADVVTKLRQLARAEAQLLFREYKKNPFAALPPSSKRISRAITCVHDAVLASYVGFVAENAKNELVLLSLVDEHLPKKLREVAGTCVRYHMPRAYVKCIVAASLASNIVYREGLQFAESLPDASLASVALQYLKCGVVVVKYSPIAMCDSVHAQR
jgi:glutamate dehydrogenase